MSLIDSFRKILIITILSNYMIFGKKKIGTYMDTTGAEICIYCLPGSSSSEGASLCTNCKPGTFQKDPGRSRCEDCLEGNCIFR